MVWAAQAASAARSSGPPSAARRSSPTRTAATTSRTPSWRWTRTASSSRCACTRRRTWAPTCRPSRSCIPTILYATLLAGQYTTPAIYCEVTAVVHQHRAGRCLSRRRPARGDLRRRAPRAPGGARAEASTAGRDPPAQLHPHASRTRRRSRSVRHRRLRRDARRGDEAWPTSRASRRARRRPRSAASCAASGYASYIEACGIAPSNVAGALGARAGPVRGGRGARAPDRQRHGVHRLAQPRPGPRDDLRAGRRRRGSASPIENVDVVHGDTGRVPFGMGTYGSRSLAVGGTAIVKALDKIVAKGKKIAAHLLEAAEADIEFEDGKFTVAGTDRSKTFGEVALDRLRAAQLPARQARAGPGRDRVLRSDQLHLPGGHAHLRGRDRSATPAWSQVVALHRRATTSATSSTR